MRATAILLVTLCGAAALQLPLAPAHRAAAVRTPLITMSESETTSRQGLWGTGDAPECC